MYYGVYDTPCFSREASAHTAARTNGVSFRHDMGIPGTCSLHLCGGTAGSPTCLAAVVVVVSQDGACLVPGKPKFYILNFILRSTL